MEPRSSGAGPGADSGDDVPLVGSGTAATVSCKEMAVTPCCDRRNSSGGASSSGAVCVADVVVPADAGSAFLTGRRSMFMSLSESGLVGCGAAAAVEGAVGVMVLVSFELAGRLSMFRSLADSGLVVRGAAVAVAEAVGVAMAGDGLFVRKLGMGSLLGAGLD